MRPLRPLDTAAPPPDAARMRWRYHNPNDPAEAAEHERIDAAIDRWWDAFVENADAIDAMFTSGGAFELVEFMRSALGGVDPRIMWEYGPGLLKGGHRLVITPEAERGLRPMATELVARAPGLPRWEFYAYRRAESVEQAEASVQGRVRASLDGTFVTASIGEHNKIDLVYHHPDTTGEDDERANAVAFVATESLLSEETLDHWIGYIDVAKAAKPGLLGRLRGTPKSPTLLPLDRLKPTVDALIDAIRSQLPPEPLHTYDDVAQAPGLNDQSNQWCTLSLEPEPRDDYPRKSDLYVAVTGVDALWRAAMLDSAFDSRRFSRHGETFCYLKLDGSDGLDAEHFEDRGAIEDTLDAALKPAALGCVHGGGTGRRYSYIDLALTDVDAAIDAIRDVLRGGNIHKRTWLLFCDADLCDEWVGVYDDTPEPPTSTDDD